MSPTNWGNFIIEYQEALNLLLDNMIKTKRRNFMVFPAIFLYRHCIELTLKEIILNTWEYLGISPRFPNGHDLSKLWKICRKYLKKVDKLVDPQATKSQEDIEFYNSLEADINKFAEIDPDSQHFRYPVDSHGNPIILNEKLLIELWRELPELVERINYNLDGISTGIYQILQDKYDALAQQENL